MSNVVNFQGALEALKAHKARRSLYKALEGRAAGLNAYQTMYDRQTGMRGLGEDADAAPPAPPAAQPIAASAVQQRLVALGFKGLSVDGKIGPQTQSAVAAFQQSVGAPMTGYVDGETWNWMNTVSPEDVIQAAAAWVAQNAPAKAATPAARGNVAPPVVTPRVLAPANASFLTKAQVCLMSPGQPFYKKPVTYIGAGAAALALYFLLKKPAPRVAAAAR